MASQVSLTAAVAGTKILASFFNTELGKVVNALNQLIVGSFGSTDITTTGDMNARDFTASRNLEAGNGLQIAGTTLITAIIDDDTMATALATNIATAESIKAYADAITTALTLAGIEDYGTSASTGVSKDQNALYIRFGQISIGSSTSQAITNLPFTDQTTYAVILTMEDGNNDRNSNATFTGDSGAQFTIYNKIGATVVFNWIAIGT